MSSDRSDAFKITLHFDDDLTFFLPRRLRAQRVTRGLREKTSVKDVIESCGVPHTEVDAILIDDRPIDFAYQLETDAEIFVSGTITTTLPHARLQRRRLTRFVADGHLGKLARDLRLLGFDVAYASDAVDSELVRISSSENRALLTRDRRLLMHRAVRDGYCLRSMNPDEQIVELLRRFEIGGSIAAFTRCVRCNGLLAPARKDEVLAQLEPLTIIYYADFRRCADCGQVYWAGSHFAKLQARLAKIRAQLITPAP